MNTRISVIIILSALFLLPSGVTAQNLITLEYSFTEGWNTDNVSTPVLGTLTIPKGPGILTTTIINEPYRKTTGLESTHQISYVNTGNPEDGTDLGLPLGNTYFQRETEIGSLTGVTDGFPLTTVSRYYSNLESERILGIKIPLLSSHNRYRQLPGKVQYTAFWEPIEPGRATMYECDIAGTWKTNLGDMTITYAPQVGGQVSLSGIFANQKSGTFDGIFTGPVLTGTWSEPGNRSGKNSGRFALLFKDSCCAFTGTRGSGESDTNREEWSGTRA